MIWASTWPTKVLATLLTASAPLTPISQCTPRATTDTMRCMMPKW